MRNAGSKQNGTQSLFQQYVGTNRSTLFRKVMSSITICPPMPARNACLDQPDASHFHRQRAVHLPEKTVDGTFAPRLSWDELSFCQTQRRCQNGDSSRRLPTPDWVLNDNRLSAVCIRFLEIRASLRKKQPGTKKERLFRAWERLKAQGEKQLKILDKLCTEYVASNNPPRRRELEIQIRNLDTTIRVSAQPWVIAAVLRAYYRERLNACQIGERFGFSAPHVRQLLHRLSLLEKRMSMGADKRSSRL